MRAHIGSDRDGKLVHTVVVTAANVADVTQTVSLLHGEETQVHAHAGYTGVEKRPEIVALPRPIDWQIAVNAARSKRSPKARPRRRPAAEKAKAAVRVRRTPLPYREKSLPDRKTR